MVKCEKCRKDITSFYELEGQKLCLGCYTTLEIINDETKQKLKKETGLSKEDKEKISNCSFEGENMVEGKNFEEDAIDGTHYTPTSADKPKKKINTKLIIVIVGAILILSIALVSADYFNLVGIGIFENKPPTLDIFIDQSAEYQPSEVTFNIDADDEDGIIKSYFIDFGDGTTSNNINPTHTYYYGSYTAVVTVTDNEGAQTSDSISINVKNKKPTATASSDISSGRVPLTVTFSSSGTDSDGTISSYKWNFGDGKISDLQNPTHTYETDGTYTAKVTVADNNGETETDSFTITVIKNSLPTAKASASKTSGYEPLTVSFTGSGTDSDGTISSYKWNFGDGYTSDTKSPSHTFKSYGTYTVTLMVTDNEGATDSDSITISVLYKVYDDTEFINWMSSDINTIIYYDEQLGEEFSKGLSANWYTIELYSELRQGLIEDQQSEIYDFDLSPDYDEMRDEYNKFLDDQWYTDYYIQLARECMCSYDYSGAADYLKTSTSYQKKATAHINECTDITNDLLG